MRFEQADECIGTPDDPPLKQVYDRIKSCVLSALGGKQLDKLDMFEAWRNKEQPKIDRLNEELDGIRKQQGDLPVVASLQDLMVDEGDDFELPNYPRKGPKGSRQRKPGNKR